MDHLRNSLVIIYIHGNYTWYVHATCTAFHSSGFFIITSPAEGLHFSALVFTLFLLFVEFSLKYSMSTFLFPCCEAENIPSCIANKHIEDVIFDEEQEPLLRVGIFQPDKALQEIVEGVM